jgi:outer membrane receptor protein involved in Fe transport
MAAFESTNTSELPIKSSVAVAVSMALTGHAGVTQAQEAELHGIEEITVTARKQAESLQDVTGSIQAITGSELKRQGIRNFEDAIRFLPSVASVGATSGANKIIFRGVSDNPGAFIAASSSALYVDEQPLTQFAVNPEPRMVDIERIEALAGPQGTLYGDSSQSGTLRIITNKPDPTEFSGGVEAMLRTGNDSDISNDFNGFVNLPLIEDKFAVRLVGFSAKDGGFIDNVLGFSPMLGLKSNALVVANNINDVTFIGGRISAKWFVNDNWSVTAAYLSQESKADGGNDYDPTVGDLKTVKFYKDTRDDDWWQASLTLEGSIGSINVLSNTSYFERDLDYVFDRTVYSAYFNYNFCTTEYLGATVVYAPAYCWSGTTIYDQDAVGFNTNHQSNDRFTQEIRLSQTTDKYSWGLGAFYEDKNEKWEYRATTPEFLDSVSYYYWTGVDYAAYTPTGTDPDWWLSNDNTNWKQWAVFGNFSYNFTDQLTAEVGLRYFDQDMDKAYFVDKPFIVSDFYPDFTYPKGGNDDWVPKVSLTYNVDDQRMVYALYSEGFRQGGANRNRVPEDLSFFPSVYEPDKLKNYEIGAKTRWMDGRLQINGTYFHGDWSNYQIEAVDPSSRACGPGEDSSVDPCGQVFQVMVANVGDAQQDGIELEIKAAPTDRVDLGFNFTWVNAETSEEFFVSDPEIAVPKGSQLPNVPEYKLATYAQYTWPVSFGSDSEMYVRGQYTWQDDSLNQLEDVTPEIHVSSRGQFVQPDYGIADLRAGLATGDWAIEAFLTNITDERAVLYNNDLNYDPFFGKRRVTTNRPREYGIKVSYSF